MRSVFITFEGTDGSGKTTQLRRQAARLAERGVDCVVTREPGGTTAGLAIRELLLAHREPALAPEAELLLYASDRAQHVREVVRPALNRGAVVLCDRHTDATVAYQGYGRGLSLDVIGRLNEIATCGLAPDLTLLFDIDVTVSLERLTERASAAGGEAPTRFDLEVREFHERVRNGYLALARADPGRIRVIDASRSVAETGREADRAVDQFIGGES